MCVGKTRGRYGWKRLLLWDRCACTRLNEESCLCKAWIRWIKTLASWWHRPALFYSSYYLEVLFTRVRFNNLCLIYIYIPVWPACLNKTWGTDVGWHSDSGVSSKHRLYTLYLDMRTKVYYLIFSINIYSVYTRYQVQGTPPAVFENQVFFSSELRFLQLSYLRAACHTCNTSIVLATGWKWPLVKDVLAMHRICTSHLSTYQVYICSRERDDIFLTTRFTYVLL